LGFSAFTPFSFSSAAARISLTTAASDGKSSIDVIFPSASRTWIALGPSRERTSASFQKPKVQCALNVANPARRP